MPEAPVSLSSEPLAEGNASTLALLICSARWNYILLEGGLLPRATWAHFRNIIVFGSLVFGSRRRSRIYKVLLFLGMPSETNSVGQSPS
jgi:hypothetical protein